MAQSNSRGKTSDSKDIIVVLLLIFLYPIGLFLMWAWTKWPKWVKIVVSLPILIAVVSIVVAFIALVMLPHKNTTNYQQPGLTTSTKENSTDFQIKDQFKILQGALTAYKQTKGVYPQSLKQLNDNIPGYNFSSINPDYIYTSTGTSYTLSAKLSNGTNYSVSSP